jgi:hypothetical protein
VNEIEDEEIFIFNDPEHVKEYIEEKGYLIDRILDAF